MLVCGARLVVLRGEIGGWGVWFVFISAISDTVDGDGDLCFFFLFGGLIVLSVYF